ncbi:MBL fold metallo-hydrolase [Fictibacillus terranigra]|uniref:MBL fold metallo-hydrolase n=1 Tax=Fictibacillus terranigra TaxID=3058424 RepID=A0ABT8E330_9BACL|nr:MBL fold metallo-hydrolase [Fictibacillus sp. CENA-BCM004]MDN4072296.1 MBL fold metallo-hydrolase [Fictibacillus sp. CENA-BCM004]
MTAAIITIILMVLFLYVFLKGYPVFGTKPSKQRRLSFQASAQFSDRRFMNEIPTVMDTSFTTTLSIAKDFIKGNPNGKPHQQLKTIGFDVKADRGSKDAGITWFGHSALMLEMDGKRMLIDPMFGKSPSPFPMFGGKRYSKTLPFENSHLPFIDAIFISHDHYDHLDFGSIKKLKEKTGRFFVPLGVGGHLERWGVDQEKISEHDWWDEVEWEGLDLVCTPARHFSGRSLTDRNATLWCSWVIGDKQTKVFFSGDSGYGPHFKTIGERYGPFNAALMECGQYDDRWSNIHMMPEETVQAFIDVKGGLLIPIHWAAFTLALHDWNDPIERVTKEAARKGLPIASPQIGETVFIGEDKYPNSVWWK